MGPRKGFFDIFRATRNMQPPKPGAQPDYSKYASSGVIENSPLTRQSGKNVRSYSSDLYAPLSEIASGVIRKAKQSQALGQLTSPQSVMKEVEQALNQAELFQHGRKARTTNLDIQSHREAYKTPYNPNPAQGHFPVSAPGALYTSQGYVSLDIETDDSGRPVAISATKFYPVGNTFEAAETFQRYYKATNAQLRKSREVHGLTRGILNKRRREQGATYSEHYNWREQLELRKFLRNQIIVGHNIHEFDLPHLFGDAALSNSTIDTLVAARDIWHDKPNDLDSVFKRLFGKTMAQAGLPHHDASSDEIATMMIFEKLSRSNTDMGEAIRYIGKNPVAVHTSTRDNYIKSVLSYGNYRDYLIKGGEVYMSENETGLKLINGKWVQTNEPPMSADVRESMHEVLPESKEEVQNEVMGAIGDIMSYMSDKLTMTQDMTSELNQAFNQFTNYRRGALVRQIVNMGEEEQIRTLRAHGITGNLSRTMRKQAAKIREIHDNEERQRFHEETEAIKKENIRRKGEYNPSETPHYWKYTSKEMEEAAKAAENLERVGTALGKIAAIPMYNFERLEGVFTEQVGGISSSFSHLVGNKLISRPVNSFASASLNAMREHYADLKYGVRFAGQLGNVAMGMGMAVPGPVGVGFKAAGALLGVGSQAVGNYGEARLVKWGQGIQNNLNTLSMLTDVTLLPIRVFGKALDAVTKNIHRFRVSITGLSSFVTSTLSHLSGMGNPMTQMTGLGYGDYMGSVSVDYASLLGRGTVSGMLTEMAGQRAGLYTTGDIDVKRLVAASMLGVFNEMYGTDANEESQLTATINKLVSTLGTQTEFQKKQTYMLANRLNPNMGSILQTMNTLGIKDFNQLKHPSNMWGYSEGQYDTFRPRWQKSYWEFSYAREQYNTTKNRVASSLWGMIGRPVANAGNRLAASFADALETGKWDGVVVKVRELWETLKTGANDTWTIIKQTFGMDTDLKFGDFIKSKVKDILVYVRDTALPAFNSVWDAIIKAAVDKFGGFIDYMSTVKIDWGQLIKNYQTNDWRTPFISTATDRMQKFDTAWATGVLSETRWSDTEGWINYMYEPSKAQQMWADSHGLPMAGTPVSSAEGLARYAQWGELYKTSPRLANERFPEFSTGETTGPSDSIYRIYNEVKSQGNGMMEQFIDQLINMLSVTKPGGQGGKSELVVNFKADGTSIGKVAMDAFGSMKQGLQNLSSVEVAVQNKDGRTQFVMSSSTGMAGQ